MGCSLVALSNDPDFLSGPVLRLRNSTCPSGEEMDQAEDVDDRVVDEVTSSRSSLWLLKVFPMWELQTSGNLTDP